LYFPRQPSPDCTANLEPSKKASPKLSELAPKLAGDMKTWLS
jgi:hypothetical protein